MCFTVCVCVCVCVRVCVGDARGHALYERVFVVCLFVCSLVLAEAQKHTHTQHFKLQVAELCSREATNQITAV